MTASEAMAQAAKALRESARNHKRASSFHRKAAKKDLKSLSELAQACKALGINLSVDA